MTVQHWYYERRRLRGLWTKSCTATSLAQDAEPAAGGFRKLSNSQVGLGSEQAHVLRSRAQAAAPSQKGLASECIKIRGLLIPVALPQKLTHKQKSNTALCVAETCKFLNFDLSSQVTELPAVGNVFPLTDRLTVMSCVTRVTYARSGLCKARRALSALAVFWEYMVQIQDLPSLEGRKGNRVKTPT
ncbi:hypothetical protein BDZ97DRAFT_2035750 [Flammula alnicola]|nr:hypothetical protein BDZ97DRAFT_2035750 [Flammula alnicola]